MDQDKIVEELKAILNNVSMVHTCGQETLLMADTIVHINVLIRDLSQQPVSDEGAKNPDNKMTK